MQNPVLYLFILFIAFIIGIFITRWIYRIDEIVELLKENNRLLSNKQTIAEPNLILNQDEPEAKEITPKITTDEVSNNNMIWSFLLIIIFIIIIFVSVYYKK